MRLLDGLATFRREGVSGLAPHAQGLFSYCALTRERLLAARLDKPVVGVVLSGAKEVWSGAEAERLTQGALFVLPAGVDLDIVNEPGERVPYQSLILEIAPDETLDVGALGAGEATGRAVPLTAERIEAVLRAARAIAAGPAAGALRGARLTELLATLCDAPAAAPLFQLSAGERAARLLRGALDERWTAAAAARRLGFSESTLRRRLAQEGTSFSGLLRRERMEAARRLLASGAASQSAAEAVGYASRAHFARAYRATFGRNPARE